jgi:hypothetical protein
MNNKGAIDMMAILIGFLVVIIFCVGGYFLIQQIGLLYALVIMIIALVAGAVLVGLATKKKKS